MTFTRRDSSFYFKYNKVVYYPVVEATTYSGIILYMQPTVSKQFNANVNSDSKLI